MKRNEKHGSGRDMPACEMCGSPNAEFVALIEGTELTVCKRCAKYGKIIRRIHNSIGAGNKAKPREKEKGEKDKEPDLAVVVDYGTRVKKAREKMGIKQEELGKKIAEKESVIHKIEAGLLEPDIELARKLERFLKVTLVEEVKENDDYDLPRKKGENLTIGDLIRMRRR